MTVDYEFDPRVGSILGGLMSLAAGNLDARVSPSPKNDELDAIITGINMLAEELSARTGKLATSQGQLLETSRHAGMAEVATCVLHNVGNVLNSVNVTAGLIDEMIRKSEATGLARAVELMDRHKGDLGKFIEEDTKGKRLPAYFRALADALEKEHRTILDRTGELVGKIDQIKAIISLQQTYARRGGVTEICLLTDVVEDAIAINKEGLKRHMVTLTRDFDALPRLVIDKQKTVQILSNLICNAKYAVSDLAVSDRAVTVRVKNAGEKQVQIIVDDNGVGIAPENLDRIFSFGFTTRKEGHGFGLHSAANAVREIGGALTVHSDGIGCGARFVLAIPIDFGGAEHG